MPFAAWVTRDAIHVDGPDTMAFLQGQLSQDLDAIAIGTARWSLLLQPNGKTVAWLRATRVGEQEVVLDGDPGSGDVVLARLERFKLRTKATLAPMFATPCLAVRGIVAADAHAALPIVWPGLEGYDQLGTSATPPPGVDVRDEHEYELARIEAGVPVFARELTDDTIPIELGQWLIDASVSFTKGCYTGQELVARIDARGGHGPRPVRRVVVEGRARAGDEITAENRVVGTLTSAAWSDDRSVTLALAALPRSVDGAIRVGGAAATIAA